MAGGRGNSEEVASVATFRSDLKLPHHAGVKVHVEEATPGCCAALGRQFKYEVVKLLWCRFDYYLFERDWRFVYGSSGFKAFSPVALMFVRCFLAVIHFSLLIYCRMYYSLDYFTSWANLFALLLLITASILSICAVVSLYKQSRREYDDNACKGKYFRSFALVNLKYNELLDDAESTNGIPLDLGPIGSPPLRRYFGFRPPFGFGSRKPSLQTVMILHESFSIIASNSCLGACFVYWVCIFPYIRANTAYGFFVNVYYHTVCLLATYFCLIFSRVPYRLYLMFNIMLVALLYCVMTMIVDLCELPHISEGKGPLYWFLDFRNKPEVAIPVCFLFVVVIAPCLMLVNWIIFWSKTRNIDPAPITKSGNR